MTCHSRTSGLSVSGSYLLCRISICFPYSRKINRYVERAGCGPYNRYNLAPIVYRHEAKLDKCVTIKEMNQITIELVCYIKSNEVLFVLYSMVCNQIHTHASLCKNHPFYMVLNWNLLRYFS